MMERIGKVELELSQYPGQDLYNDGEVEAELLSIVQETPREEYGKVIEEKKQWPVLYHLSPLRENIVDWLPLTGGDKVLEVGSGCGAITGALARKAGQVTCVDLSKRRSQINAYRHQDCENVVIHVGNFKDIEPGLPCDYDYICLIGVFEYGQGYIGGETPYEDFLKLLLGHLGPEGRIIIAIENKYGLKYFAGCREDHLGTYFGGIEDYRAQGGVRTFGRKGLEKIFRSCGVSEWHFYYPYPDYKFMTVLYSDGHLPGKGELSNNLRNFDRDRMLLFDEKSAFDGILEEGLFPVFSNSYLAVLGKELPVEYVKYSNDRAEEYGIRTVIGKSPAGELYVMKSPLSGRSAGHVENMYLSYEKLMQRYQGGKLKLNQCELLEDGRGLPAACFEYVKGTPLSELMDACLEKGDIEGFYAWFREYVERVSQGEELPVADFDLVFSNILVDGEDWTLIDYEWTFGRALPAKELAYRAVYCYLLEDEKRRALDEDRILRELGMSREEAENCRQQEMEFQRFVTGGRRSMAQLREDMGHRILVPQKWIDRYQDSAEINRLQIYEDKGAGYSEEESYFVREAYQGENLIVLDLKVDGQVKSLRIDPAMDVCAVKLLELSWNGEPVNWKDRHFLTVNGRLFHQKGGADGESEFPSFVFATEDPNINLRLERLSRAEENRLQVKMEIRRLPLSLARDLTEESMLGRVMGR